MIGGLPEDLDDDIAFNSAICRILPNFAFEAVRFTQLPKKLIDANNPELGVRGAVSGAWSSDRMP
eukprot:11456514-Alexandrium_andersonii.AAC.1